MSPFYLAYLPRIISRSGNNLKKRLFLVFIISLILITKMCDSVLEAFEEVNHMKYNLKIDLFVLYVIDFTFNLGCKF